MSRPDVVQEEINRTSINDQPTTKDSLGFKLYVESIADFLVNIAAIFPTTHMFIAWHSVKILIFQH